MQLELKLHACKAGAMLPLALDSVPQPAHILLSGSMPSGVGMCFFTPEDDVAPLLTLAGTAWITNPHGQNAGAYFPAPLLLAQKDITEASVKILHGQKRGYAVAVITLSDKGAAGERTDKSGPKVLEMLSGALPTALRQSFLIADNCHILRGLMAKLALLDKFDLICTTGGTGVGPRDITPQITKSLLDLDLPGFSQAMMQASLAKTPNASISRSVCGIIGQTLVINLPGSVKAAAENLEAVLPALAHCLAKLNGDTADCGA